MAPINPTKHIIGWLEKRGHGKSELTVPVIILEAWGQGLTVGAFVILLLIVACNYRRGVILHKLILLEMFLAMFHAFFIFFDDPAYGWYLSASSSLLFVSYQLHNVVAYLKIRTFLSQTWARRVFILTLVAVQPYWVIEAWDNFEYFNENIDWNIYTRPWEALFRDPWWIFTTVFLFYKIKAGYDFTVMTLFKSSPRFGIMTMCMVLSIGFMLADIIVTAESLTVAKGINPYWRLSLVFKCASDTIFLDDFKSVLDRIVQKRFERFSNAGLDNVGVSPSAAHANAQAFRSPHSPQSPQSPISRTKKLWHDRKYEGPIEVELELGRSHGQSLDHDVDGDGDVHSIDRVMASSSEDTVTEARNGVGSIRWEEPESVHEDTSGVSREGGGIRNGTRSGPGSRNSIRQAPRTGPTSGPAPMPAPMPGSVPGSAPVYVPGTVNTISHGSRSWHGSVSGTPTTATGHGGRFGLRRAEWTQRQAQGQSQVQNQSHGNSNGNGNSGDDEDDRRHPSAYARTVSTQRQSAESDMAGF